MVRESLWGDAVSSVALAPRNEARVQLSFRKGSRLIPIILLLLSVTLFVGYGLPAGHKQLGVSLGLIENVNATLTLETLQDKLNKEAELKKLWEKMQKKAHDEKWGVWGYVENLVRPLFKMFVDQLGRDFITIAKSSLVTIFQLSLFSLLPGLAGLIYRRNFWVWFLASLLILLGINASGFFGKLTSAQVMPGSGAIFFFLLFQLGLLLLAYRLRRHVQSASLWLPPKVHNWGLTVLLVLVGVACWQGWGPGYSSGETTAVATTDDQKKGVATESPPSRSSAGELDSRAAPPTSARTAAPAARTDSAAPAALPAGPPTNVQPSSAVEQKTTGKGATRSWIWAFLGTGFPGWFYKWEFILIGLPLIHTLLRNSANWTARTNKNIVICLDGTSNTPDQIEMGFAAQTNVFKLFRMLKGDDGSGYSADGHFDASLCKRYKDKQIAFYYAGVGNKYDNDAILQTFGMATGMGAGDIIERAYLDLVRVYRPGDRVYIVGFSRGAAISRLLARTIDARGAPRTVWTLRLLGKHRVIWSSPRKVPVKIDVLGCWDTVGSFGVAKTILGINFQQLNLFKDLTVPDNVLQAYHMVALDEQRDSFEPTLMDPDPIRPERIVEVWFAGDHANIGGGWATDSLSDVTLDFLLRRISSGYATDEDPEARKKKAGNEAWGIYLTAEKTDKADLTERQVDHPGWVDPDPLGQVRQWFSNLYEYRPRRLPLHAVISEAVFDRMTQSMPVYAPQALFNLNDDLDKKRDLIDEKVAKLVETESLVEDERQKIINYKNKLRLRRWPEYWAELLDNRKGKLRLPEVALDNRALDQPVRSSGRTLPRAPVTDKTVEGMVAASA
ncbi:MAG: DUF2235 domain-containing protein [Hyphomicrobiaceae bacterium]|nr:MAG: DUF2235 domain-containing protein [Hyphomicrobiaceae bacterium]